MIDSVAQTNRIAPTRIIACAVFRPALEHLQLTKQFPLLHIAYLPSRLHNMPLQLEKRLLKEILSWRKKGERVLCLYGECFPGMKDFCQRLGVARVSGAQCDEILLGHQRFEEITPHHSRQCFRRGFSHLARIANDLRLWETPGSR